MKDHYLTSLLLSGVLSLSACGGRTLAPELLNNTRLTIEQGNSQQAYKDLCAYVKKYLLTYELVSLHVQTGLNVQDLDGIKDFYDGDSQWDLYAQGMWQAAVGDYLQAVASFRKALLINPEENELHYRLAIALSEAGQYAEALKEYDQAEHYGNINTKLNIRKAMAHVGLEHYDEAMLALKKGLEFSMSRADLQSYIDYSFIIVQKRRHITTREMEAIMPVIGQLSSEDVNLDDAMVPLQNLLQRFPESAMLHAALGLYYLKNQEDAKGMEAIRRAMKYDPADPYPPLVMGQYLLDGKNGTAAMPYLQQAYTANPLDIQVAEQLLGCARMIADRQAEQEALTTLAALDPMRTAYITQLAMYNQSEGKLEKAAGYYLKVLDNDKNNLPALYGLAAIYWEEARGAKSAAERKDKLTQTKDYLVRLLTLAPEHQQALQLAKSVEAYQGNHF